MEQNKRLLEENNWLKEHIYAVETKWNMYRSKTAALHAQCTLSQIENYKQKQELAKMKKKKKSKINTLACF